MEGDAARRASDKAGESSEPGTPQPEAAEIESARLLAGQARDELAARGVGDDEIRRLADQSRQRIEGRSSVPSSNGLRGELPKRVELELRPKRTAPAEARRALDRLEGLEDETREDARLVVSELVANSVRHAGLGPKDRIRLEIEQRPDAVALEVVDPGAGFDFRPGRRAVDRDAHWGLFLIEHLASEWGVRRADGSRVWCVIPRSRRAS